MTTTEPANRLAKTLTWKDGFAVALTTPNGLFVTFGYLIGVIGAYTAIAIWVVGAVIAYLQCQIFAENASMFPRDSGGVARYAMEGWKRYFAPLGAIAAFGYWIGWSLSASAVAVAFGELITATWFPDVDASLPVLGNDLGLQHVIAVLGMTGAWAFNYFGMKLGASINKVLGVLVLTGLALISVACVFSPGADWSASNLSWSVEGGWKTIFVAFYATAWVTYGTEIVASFAPEYRNTTRDTGKALRRASLFMIAVFLLVPLAVSGSIGEGAIAENPVTYIVVAFNQTLGGFGWIGTVIVASSILISMVSCTADGGRALYGLAQEGMTLKQLDSVNRFGVPGRSLTLDLGINTGIMILVANPISILLASNLGYLISITLGAPRSSCSARTAPTGPAPSAARTCGYRSPACWSCSTSSSPPSGC